MEEMPELGWGGPRVVRPLPCMELPQRPPVKLPGEELSIQLPAGAIQAISDGGRCPFLPLQNINHNFHLNPPSLPNVMNLIVLRACYHEYSMTLTILIILFFAVADFSLPPCGFTLCKDSGTNVANAARLSASLTNIPHLQHQLSW